jgi:hypothetical protein
MLGKIPVKNNIIHNISQKTKVRIPIFPLIYCRKVKRKKITAKIAATIP